MTDTTTTAEAATAEQAAQAEPESQNQAELDPDMVDCDDCGETVHCDDTFGTADGETVCTDCLNGGPYVWCEDEETWAHHISQEVRQCNYTGHYATRRYATNNWFCHDVHGWFESQTAFREWCDDNDIRDEPDADIFGYHDVDVIEHLGWPDATPRDSLCMGVELEMEHREDNSEDGQAALCAALGGREGNGRYVLMTDGSLNDSGVEMVTLPYTLEFHRDKFGWPNVLGTAKPIGRSGAGTTACGMHVHVNRKAPILTPLTIGKLLVFVNAKSNSTLIETVAQRTGESYAKRYEKQITDGHDPHAAQDGRYEALNFTRRTIEFRIFRGNLRADRVLKNLEFVEASILFCRDTSPERLGTADFLGWLVKRRSQYPNLFRFLVEKEMITDKHTAARLDRVREA
jgi:hypothetical protein